ncbi:MAG: ABC transporter permease [Spirochaetales bacterium]|nr:ABC transporter permease [Spirochaetales bacterium]
MNDLKVSVRGIIAAIISTIAVTILLLVITGDSPVTAFLYFLSGPFRNSYSFGNFLNTAFILSLTGMGISIAFKSGFFNIGGEAQVYAGTLSAALVASALSAWPGILGIPVILLAAILTGAVVAGISGLLRAFWNIDELISSFLLSATLIPFIDFLISIPFRDPKSYLMSSGEIARQFHLPRLLGASNLNTGIFIVLLLGVAMWFVFNKTIFGYELRILGSNQQFAHYGGIRIKLYAIIVMAVSGALHSLAGGLIVLGYNQHAAIQGITSGLGWNGIAVALIARNKPEYVFPSALIFAFIQAGTQTLMTYSDFKAEFASIIQAAVFFLVTAQSIRIGRNRRAK